MRDHSKHIQVDKEEAVSIILKNCRFDPETETVPVSEASGRILAEDVRSQWDSPNVLTCRMDSVAVHWSDFENGMPDTSGWIRDREWEFANTGVAMPEGFDTAIVIEHVILSDDNKRISFDAAPSKRFAGTSAPGSKLKKDDIMVKAGACITPLIAAYIASGNNIYVKVIKKPAVAFIPTGNELVEAGTDIPAGRNIESNSYMISEKIRLWGGEPLILKIVPDEKEALKKALRDAAEKADIVVLNAGSSKGNDDWGIEMLEEVGTVFYHQTSHGPGHHSSFGVIGKTPVIGISGPPGGAAFTTDYYLYPAMMAYSGKEPQLTRLKVRLAGDIRSAVKQLPMAAPDPEKGEDRPRETGRFHTVRQLRLVQAEDGIIEALPLGNMHPGPVEAETADAYYVMPTWGGEEPPSAGDLINVELRPEYRRLV